MTTLARNPGFLRVGTIVAGPVLAIVSWMLLRHAGVAHEPSATAGIAMWMAWWWITEAVPIPATALLPIVAFPAAGVLDTRAASAPYAHDLIFLFLGGFILGLSLEKWNAHKRIALGIIRIVGTRPRNIIAGFMVASAGLSMFVSNTATVIMLLPIGVSVIRLVMMEIERHRPADPRIGRNFPVALLLGIAYAASVGGVATINGTPPNGILVAYLQDHLDTRITYAQWMAFGLPLTAVMLPLTWALLVYVVLPVRIRRIEGAGEHIAEEWRQLGPLSRGEATALIVFACTALAWIVREPLVELAQLPEGREVTDTGIALLGALALFVIPVDLKKRQFAMDWETAARLPWGVLILFGGGLSLAKGIQASGLDSIIGQSFGHLGDLPPVLILGIIAMAVVFLTEVCSNTAVTSALLPVLTAAAPGLGLAPGPVCVVAAVCASFAFMLPVATPPNAIVFSTGNVTIRQMARAGILLNILGTLVITSFVVGIGARLLDMPLSAP